MPLVPGTHNFQIPEEKRQFLRVLLGDTVKVTELLALSGLLGPACAVSQHRAMPRGGGGRNRLTDGRVSKSARRFGRLEAVFQDLPVERPAADVEHASRFLLVPVHGFENSYDVCPFGLGERRQAIARRRCRRYGGVQELDVGRADRPARRRQRRP